jgi:hypothetical protein
VASLPSPQHLPSEGPVRLSHLVPKTSLDGGDAVDEAVGCDDLVTGLRLATRGTKGKFASRLASVGTARLAKASSEGWRLCLRPNICPPRGQFD